MTDAQREALQNICDRYHVVFREDDYRPQFDLPDGYVGGWVGGLDHGLKKVEGWVNGFLAVRWARGSTTTIYIGCDPEGRISS